MNFKVLGINIIDLSIIIVLCDNIATSIIVTISVPDN